MNMKVVPILLAFFAMGVADAMGPLSDAVEQNYQISTFLATLMSFFVFIAFAVFSVPGGLLAARIGKKKLLLLGLGMNALAMLVPCVIDPPFAVLLACIFVLGIGTTFLQVAGNPIMHDVSAEGNFSRNLAFAQGIKGIGSTVSSWLATAIATLAAFAFLKEMGWRGVFPFFFILMAGSFLWVATLKIEETTADVPPSIGSSLSLLGKPVFAMAVLGIFLYVGAEASMARFLKPFMVGVGFEEAQAAKYGAAMFFLMLTIGRLVGGAVVSVMSPRNFFRLSALMGLVGALMMMFGGKGMAVPAVVLAGLGFANIWPMLFSITVEEDPKRGNELSGLMCMAISGGAIVPLIMSAVQGSPEQATEAAEAAEVVKDISMSFLVPAICFGYLFLISLKGGGSKPAPAAVDTSEPTPPSAE